MSLARAEQRAAPDRLDRCRRISARYGATGASNILSASAASAAAP
jgi:hypothetical protein